MGLRIACCALTLLSISSAHGQTVPLVDHHQHLFSPATVALVSPRPLPPVDLPRALDSLVRARGGAAQNASALRDVYTDSVVLMHFAQPGWIRGRDSVAAWWIRSTPAPYHGVCIEGATVQVVRGQRVGESITQTTPCDAWSYGAGFQFRGLTPGVEMTLRASARGYADEEQAVAPSLGAQTAMLFAPRLLLSVGRD